MPEYLSTADVARQLQVSEATVKRMFKDGRIAALNFGTPERPTYRVRQESIDSFLEQGQVQPA